ncbi:helicase C-terminal domain-containing protein [Leucobacter japonicus]|uniref:helicase C-terminal domain-containing protein n=1 Tax=Leucobacter japonicus TaxID=1461259 RepID=UPI0006A77A7C|nr:helicase C-terminal domain-containing protein [Leucobacter japonicus]
MGIFDGLDEENLADTITDPKRLFRALAKPAGSPYKFPHDIQTEVWDRWYPRREEPDLIVKMNTGSGKTVIGLLMLKSSLNEGIGPAVFLVRDKQLQKQAQETATRLGILWAAKADDPLFRQSEAILIAPVHAMYNGKSVFGVRGSGWGTLPVGAIVVDDAHACIPIIEQQFSLRIRQGTEAYRRLFALFQNALKEQSLSGHSGLVSGEGSVAVPVPYWDWQHHIEEAFNILSSSDPDKFVWPLIQDQLKLCDVAVTPTEIEIRLPLPDLSAVPSFADAARRIYMTATLADDSILTTHMNVEPSCVTAPIIPASASDLGDRIILTPLQTSRDITRTMVLEKLKAWAANYNVVVIVPSRKRADEWRHMTSEVHDKETIEQAVQRLQSEHVGLVVLVARYDGLDLPGDACRILVLDGLPEINSPWERVELEMTLDAEDLNQRQIQRIEQGMGRGVRATDDYCAVVLLDPRLVDRLYLASAVNGLSPATRAQYELSAAFSKRGRGKGIEFFEEAVSAFLGRESGWTSASKRALEGVTYDSLEAVPVRASGERTAFEHALAGRYMEAKQALDPAIRAAKKGAIRGWEKQRAASYLNCVNAVDARALQKSARLDNSRLLKLGNDIKLPRLTSLGNQAAAVATYLTDKFSSAEALQISVEAMLRDLIPSEEHGSYTRFEAAMEQLGLLLGFASSRPDRDSRIGPDNLWAIGDDRFWVLEAKSEATATEISRDNLEQLTHSADWFERDYSDPRYSYTPILIHPSALPMVDAVPRQNARVITFDDLAGLREAVKAFVGAIASPSAMRDEAVIRENLSHLHLSAGQLEQKWTRPFASR